MSKLLKEFSYEYHQLAFLCVTIIMPMDSFGQITFTFNDGLRYWVNNILQIKGSLDTSIRQITFTPYIDLLSALTSNWLFSL